MFRGIHKTKKLSKLRSGHAKEEEPAGNTDADKETKLQNQQLNAIFNSYQKRFCKPLNLEMFTNHAPFYPFGIDADIVYELR